MYRRQAVGLPEQRVALALFPRSAERKAGDLRSRVRLLVREGNSISRKRMTTHLEKDGDLGRDHRGRDVERWKRSFALKATARQRGGLVDNGRRDTSFAARRLSDAPLKRWENGIVSGRRALVQPVLSLPRCRDCSSLIAQAFSEAKFASTLSEKA